MKSHGNFGEGAVWKNIVAQAFPLMLAQLVQLAYNIVDRIYIGHMPGIGTMALTGIGLAFPLTTLIQAFTSLFAVGGTPLFSIARGQGDRKRAEKILSQVVTLLVGCSLILFLLCYFFRKPVLYLFGASDISYPYADAYLKIYLWGTTFSMFGIGMNNFINAQGYPKLGMMTTVIGALLNLILDPLFIFVLNMGIQGAAVATVLSQAVSAVWVLLFFMGRKTEYKIKPELMIPNGKIIKDILALGVSGFIAKGTNCAVQVICNATLRTFGGDLYVGIMTCINSIREIAELPVFSLTSGAQPVLGFNYGARKFKRLRSAIRFSCLSSIIYTILGWFVIMGLPKMWISIFTSDPQMIEFGVPSLKIYFAAFIFMSFQSAGQSTFTSLGCSKRAVFFSLLRKVIIVIPLTIMLPRMGMGANGVFAAEPVSNVLGGLAAFITMYLTLYRKLPKEDEN
ncbi:MAG: MATE family efflux transporter [Clostridia bacterium]|nr:MATE family efflux transporter [Clostridia bacterium]